MHRVAEADVVRTQRHDQRMGAVSVSEEADPLQQVARCDSTGGEDDLLARREIFGSVDLVRVGDAHPFHAPACFVVIDHQASDHSAVKTAHGRGSNYAFWSPADSHHGMYA